MSFGGSDSPPPPPDPVDVQRRGTLANIALLPEQLAAQEEFGPQFDLQAIESQRRFALAGQALEQEISPELASVRKNLGLALQKRLETPEKLPQAQLDKFRETVRAGQALRGVATSGISAVSEARQLTEVTEAAGARVRGEALSFLGLGTPGFAGGSAFPGVGVSTGTAGGIASAFGAQGLQAFGIQQQLQQQRSQQIGGLGADIFGLFNQGPLLSFEEQNAQFVGPVAPEGSNLFSRAGSGAAIGGSIGGLPGAAIGGTIGALSSIFGF